MNSNSSSVRSTYISIKKQNQTYNNIVIVVIILHRSFLYSLPQQSFLKILFGNDTSIIDKFFSATLYLSIDFFVKILCLLPSSIDELKNILVFFIWHSEHKNCLSDIPVIILDRRQVCHYSLSILLVCDDTRHLIRFLEFLLLLIPIWACQLLLEFLILSSEFVKEIHCSFFSELTLTLFFIRFLFLIYRLLA